MSHDLKWTDLVELLLACKEADERRECFTNLVARVAARDNMADAEVRQNLLTSLRYVAGYYGDDTRKRVMGFARELSGEG